MICELFYYSNIHTSNYIEFLIEKNSLFIEVYTRESIEWIVALMYHTYMCTVHVSSDINPNMCTDVQYRSTVHKVTPTTHVRTDVQYGSTVHKVTPITHVCRHVPSGSTGIFRD